VPLYLKRKLPNDSVLGIWKIEESFNWFQSNSDILRQYKERAKLVKSDQKKLHILSVGALIPLLISDAAKLQIKYNQFGKPYLEGDELSISISHSHGFVATLFSKTKGAGVDIEKIANKIERIADKFMNEAELLDAGKESGERRIEYKHVVWGVKESIFKLYGKGELPFKEGILLESFNYDEQGSIKANLVVGNINKVYDVHYQKIEDYMLVYVTDEC